MGIPEGYAIWDDTPPEQVRRDGTVVYVSRSLAEARGWVEPRETDEAWFAAREEAIMSDYPKYGPRPGRPASEQARRALANIGSPIPAGKVRATCGTCGEQFLADSLAVARTLMGAHPCGMPS